MCLSRVFSNMSYSAEANRQISEVFRNEKFMNQIRHARHLDRLQNITAGYSPEPIKLTFKQKLGIFLDKMIEKNNQRKIR